MARSIVLFAVLSGILATARLIVPPHDGNSNLPMDVPVRIWFAVRAPELAGSRTTQLRLRIVGWAAEGRVHTVATTFSLPPTRAPRGWSRLTPGQLASGRGTFTAGADGHGLTFVPSTTPAPLGHTWVGPRALAARANEQLNDTLLERFDQPAAGLASARILGRRDLLERGTWVSYRDAGILHVLAISGLHLALLGAFLGTLLRWLGVSLEVRAAVLIAVVVAYAAVVGMRPPVVRAAVMASVVSAACLCRRRPDAWAALCVAFIACLAIEPRWLTTPGFQLSFVAVAAILYSHRGVGIDLEESLVSALGPRRSKVRRTLVEGLQITAAVTVVMDPLLAFYFQRVNLATFPGNMLVMPVASAALGLSWCALLPWVGSALAPIAECATTLELAAANLTASIPALRTIVRPPSIPELCGYYITLAVILRFAPRPRAGALLLLLGATLVSILRQPAPMDEVLWQGPRRTHMVLSERNVRVTSTSPHPRRIARHLSRRGARHIDLLELAPTVRRESWRRAMADEGIQLVSVHGGR